MRLQAALVSLVWIAFVLALGLPSYMAGIGVAVAVALAWRDHYGPDAEVFERVEYDEPEPDDRREDEPLVSL